MPSSRGRVPIPETVSTVQFIEPAHTRELPEQYSPVADHSDAAMRGLRTPFDTDPFREP
ncbi:hypothetical protein J2S53_003764 [Actinopolyspora lacussalsi]|uniref:hypothetical protein n=1 Tax=Actinopolyspora righensis TaxID=995060 RepID=UPI0013EE80E9|nr:hypothetical protein [Actinopolyspora righensis]MDP9643819.1 hypothetical protein [Actinopolyspora lacussalsi]